MPELKKMETKYAKTKKVVTEQVSLGDLEKDINNLISDQICAGTDYLPFGINYMEIPEPIGREPNANVYDVTSVTFCTFRGIPLVDDPD